MCASVQRTYPLVVLGVNKKKTFSGKNARKWVTLSSGGTFVERNGSGVELRTLDYKNPGLNPVLHTLGKFVHSTLLQFIQLYK